MPQVQGRPSLYIEFCASKGYIVKPCLRKWWQGVKNDEMIFYRLSGFGLGDSSTAFSQFMAVIGNHINFPNK